VIFRGKRKTEPPADGLPGVAGPPVRIRPGGPYDPSKNPAPDSRAIEEKYDAAQAALDEGNEFLARQELEVAVKAFAHLRSVPSLATPHLAMSLLTSAELIDGDGSYGAAAERYTQAAEVFSMVADRARELGDNQQVADAQAEADEAAHRADVARDRSSKARTQAARLANRDAELRASQFESFSRSIGRI
jgi:hypothetical protein